MDSLASFHPVVRAWFEESYGKPSPPQELGWPHIAAGRNALILAPTGSGKTLAAFLKCLDVIYSGAGSGPEPGGVQVLYISPLKALNNDIHKNLEVPLEGIRHKAVEMGVDLPQLRTAVRTGDTPAAQRQAMVRRPPHVLITTPESLYLLLTSQARRILRTVRYVIVDEIHAVCGTKRGVHLSLSLERLEALLPAPPVRIGLSATQRPLEEIARYLGGVGRPVEIVDTGARKQLDLQVEVPVDDMRALPDNTMWAAIHPRLLELIEEHRSTLIFVNNRGLAERLAQRLNGLAGKEIARTHHGSLSRVAREQVEADLKEGRLPCLVATSSLELGIDVGFIDLVVQVESPKSVARGLQRVGRAGHLLGAASRGRLVPKFRGDLLETACIVREMLRGNVESTRIPQNCLDVLAQQVTAMAAVDDWQVEAMLALIRGSHCYRNLSRSQLESVLDMLSGRYPSEEFSELRARIYWDREQDTVRAREGARTVAILSGGTIPDRGYYGVYLQGANVKLGEMDEEFIYESRVGDVFLLGTSTWRIESIEHDRITVVHAYGQISRMPFWKGDMVGRTYEMGLQLGAFTREAATMQGATLATECALDRRAADNLVSYLQEMKELVGALPSDRQVVVEHYLDEAGDRRVVVHSPFGWRVHTAWAIAMRHQARALLHLELETMTTDDALLIRLPGADAPPPLAELVRLTPAQAEEFVLREVPDTPLFAASFRMNAARSLVLPRPRPGKRMPFWLQRLKAADLLQIARRYESFPLVLETYREVMQETLDMHGLSQVLEGLLTGRIGLQITETAAPSPMATSVLMGFVGIYMYEKDTPKAERKGALLNLNRDLLREVLGSEALRDLFDSRAVADVHQRLQRLDLQWQARNHDEVEDLLRRLGALTAEEVGARAPDGAAWLERLAAEGRAVPVDIAGERRWAAAQDLPLYQNPHAHAGAHIRRYARTHAPFTSTEAAARFGLPHDLVTGHLALMLAEGLLATGEYTPGRAVREYCDPEVLQAIHRRTLTVLRQEVQPVEPPVLASFLHNWQTRGPLKQVVRQLQGLYLPADLWERDLFRSRVQGYQPVQLDQLCATGDLMWAGAGAGRRRVAFFLPDGAARPTSPAQPVEGADHAKVRGALRDRGASFLGPLSMMAGLTPGRCLEVLWDLVWNGEVTNDTFAPVRQALRAIKAGGRARANRPLLGPQHGGTGRWSLLEAMEPVDVGAYAGLLLQRYGVVCREVVLAEEGPFTWSEVLQALKPLEWRGLVRQGYFIAGLSGAQFALPEAVELLRQARENPEESTRLIAVCDPANPYGTLLPAPDEARLSRMATSYLVLSGGVPAMAVEGFGKRLIPLTPDGATLARAACALRDLLAAPAALRPQRKVDVEFWGDEPILQSAGADLLREVGFERAPTRMTYWAPAR